MKRFIRNVAVMIACIGVILTPSVWADVEPGEVINQGNWEKIQGMVPDFVLTWVKNGDMDMKIGKLNFNKSEFCLPEQLASLKEKTNQGRYVIDDQNAIVDTKTNTKYPRDIMGFPFSEPDYNSPRIAYQLIYNAHARILQRYGWGQTDASTLMYNIGRKGLERELEARLLIYFPDPSTTPYDFFAIGVYTKPYDFAGNGALTYTTGNPEVNNMRWIYTPMLKKLRRYTGKVLGCESVAGCVYAEDDMWAGGPVYRVSDGEYRLVEKKMALIPYFSENPGKLTGNLEEGLTFKGSEQGGQITMGYEKEGWKGAPWAFTNIVWIKTSVVLLESKALNPEYFYGPSVGWFDAETYTSVFKVVTDSNGKFWKGYVRTNCATQTSDGKYRFIFDNDQICYDAKRDYATCAISLARPGTNRQLRLKTMNSGIFTPAGFVKFLK